MKTATRTVAPLTLAQIDKRLTIHARQLQRGSAGTGVIREDVLEGADQLLDLRLELTEGNQ